MDLMKILQTTTRPRGKPEEEIRHGMGCGFLLEAT